jgi:hypothetical protein
LRLGLFSSLRVGSNMKHVHTFGCPVFALQNALASGNQLPHWSPRACLGLNFGPSPMHARNLYLVLNLVIGGPHKKMPFFQIAPGPILSSVIHSNSSQCDPCKVWLKKMTTSLPTMPPKFTFVCVLVTELVIHMFPLETNPVLALPWL